MLETAVTHRLGARDQFRGRQVFPTGQGGCRERFGMIHTYRIHRALDFYSDYISSSQIIRHQEAGDPWSRSSPPWFHLPQPWATILLGLRESDYFRFCVAEKSCRICLSLSDFISLSIMPSRSIRVVTNGKIAFSVSFF